MGLHRSRLFRSSLIYVFSNGLSYGLPMLLLPFLTRFLGPSEYGIVSLHAVATMFLAPVVGINVNGAMSKRFYDVSSDEIARYNYNCLLLVLIASGITGLGLWAFAAPLSSLIKIPSNWLWSLLVLSFSQFISLFLTTLWQVQHRALRVAYFQISLCGLVLAATFVFVRLLGLGWRGVVLGQISGYALTSLWGLSQLFREKLIVCQVNRADMRHAFSFGARLLPHSLATTTVVLIDKIILVQYYSLKESGLYEVGAQFSGAIRLLTVSFNQAWFPWFFSKLKTDRLEDRQSIVKITYAYFLIAPFLALGYATLAKFVIGPILGHEYVESAPYVYWLSLAFAFNGMYFMVTNYLFYVEKTHYLSVISLIGGALSVGLNLLLIPRIGPIGAAQAAAASFLAIFLMTWIASSRQVRMPWISPFGAEGGNLRKL